MYKAFEIFRERKTITVTILADSDIIPYPNVLDSVSLQTPILNLVVLIFKSIFSFHEYA